MIKPSLFKMSNGVIIEYFIIKKKVKNLSIRLNTKNEIILTIPIRANEQKVNDFLEKHIIKFYEYQNKNKNNNGIDYIGKTFYLFGELIEFNICSNNEFVLINNKKISIKNRSVEDAINLFRKKELKVYLIQAQLKFEKIMSIPNHLISIRQKSRAWATNYVTKNKIYYSTKLSLFNKEIINYVIIHELAHHKFPNHSSEFWNFVNLFDSMYKLKKKKLNNYQFN